MSTNQQPQNAYRIPVPPSVEEVISHFYFAENDTSDALTKTLLPSYQTLLVFAFGPKTSLSTRSGITIAVDKCLLIGPVKQAFEYTMQPGAKILVVNFKGDAYYRFFGIAAVTDRLVVNPDELIVDNCFTGLWHSLQGLSSVQEQVDFLLHFCKPYIRQSDAVAIWLLDFKDEALNPVKAIARKTGETERSVQLKQKKYFGYSAKELSRYKRFLKATELIQKLAATAEKVDWFEVIDQCGYYDQSQFIRDFKHYINLSPTKYLKFQQALCSSHSG